MKILLFLVFRRFKGVFNAVYFHELFFMKIKDKGPRYSKRGKKCRMAALI